MDTVPNFDFETQVGGPDAIDAIEGVLSPRLDWLPPGWVTRCLTLADSPEAVTAWLQGLGDAARLFPALALDDGPATLATLVRSETQPPGVGQPERPDDLPPLPRGWHRWQLTLWVTLARPAWRDGWTAPFENRRAAVLTLRPALGGTLAGTIEYLAVLEPWIETLRKESCGRWQWDDGGEAGTEGGAPEPETGPAERDRSSAVTITGAWPAPRCNGCRSGCDFIKRFERALLEWADQPANQGEMPERYEITGHEQLYGMSDRNLSRRLARHRYPGWRTIQRMVAAGDMSFLRSSSMS